MWRLIGTIFTSSMTLHLVSAIKLVRSLIFYPNVVVLARTVMDLHVHANNKVKTLLLYFLQQSKT